MNIRTLRADEIECRVQSVKENGFSLLLYKDARVDMNILDEVFGMYGWQRKHELIGDRLYCTISVYDKQTKQWIAKQDVGTESYTEKEKGQASDSFKRAAFNIGIGRELYTAPFIWIVNKNDIKNYKGKLSVSTRFAVKEIGYNDNREINHLVIVDNRGDERYRLGKKQQYDSTTRAEGPPKVNQQTYRQNKNDKKDVDEDKQAIIDNSLATDRQIKAIYAIAKSKNYSKESIESFIKSTYKKDSIKALTKQEASEMIQMLNELNNEG